MEYLTISEAPEDFRIALLEGLGFGVDDGFIVDGDGERVIDPYIDETVRLDNMVIFPGSTIILDNNPLSIASYFEEYGEPA